MTTTNTKAYDNKKPMTLPPTAVPQWVAVDIEMPTAAPAANDMILAATIPVGYKVLDWAILSPDCDSGGSALAFSLGVALDNLSDLGAGASDVWVAGSTALATGVPARNLLPNALNGDSTVERVVALKCTVIATTYAGSGKVAKLMLLLQG